MTSETMTPITDTFVLARKADRRLRWVIDGDNALKGQREASELGLQFRRIGDIDLMMQGHDMKRNSMRTTLPFVACLNDASFGTQFFD